MVFFLRKGEMIMNWNKDKSITLSFVCLAVFSAVLLAMDIFCIPVCRSYLSFRKMNMGLCVTLALSVYICSVFAWITIVYLWKLLSNIGKGEVFIQDNVRNMRIVSWCCAGVAAVCLVLAFTYIPYVFVAVAAAFMTLIVRIVKNTFEQAIAMKAELDLTI